MQTRPALTLCLALASFGCESDDPERPVVELPTMDAGSDAEDPNVPDTSCVDSIGFQDFDDDGFSRSQGDCDDCDFTRGPAAQEIAGNGIDDDCKDGDLAAPPAPCDVELREDETEPDQIARALGLCERLPVMSRRWGLIKASYERLNGSDELADSRQVWLPERFGRIAPRDGSRMLVLSTGVARDVGADDYTPGCDAFGSAQDGGTSAPGVAPPAGFPRDSSSCSEDVSRNALAYDDVGLTLRLRAPTNARAFAFDSLFLTYEYPDFVCSRFNDFFVVLMDPPPRRYKDDDNILIDINGDPIGVNSGLLSVCTKSDRSEREIECQQGPGLLEDTGYGADEAECPPLREQPDIGGASTGWLHTEMPVEPGKIFELRFRLWDSGDPQLDSTVLLDAFRFLERPANEGTGPVSLTSG